MVSCLIPYSYLNMYIISFKLCQYIPDDVLSILIYVLSSVKLDLSIIANSYKYDEMCGSNVFLFRSCSEQDAQATRSSEATPPFRGSLGRSAHAWESVGFQV